MAEGDSGSGSNFGFLTHKVGPLPVWMWAAIAVAGYYWYTHYGPGASKQASAAGQKVQVIRDQISSSGTGIFGGGSKYKTNAEWEDAAVSYLVGESVPPDEAASSVWNFIHSKQLTTQEQKDINLAIEGIGPPPKIPEPVPVPSTQPHKHPHPGHRKPPEPRVPPKHHLHKVRRHA